MHTPEPSSFEYFKRCVTEKYADFDGRARRSEYWYYQLFMLMLYMPFIIMMIVGGVLESPVIAIIGGAIFTLLAFGLLVPSIAVTVRRLHDTNKSGWFYLLAFVPGASIVIFIFSVMEGDRRPNLYGPDPKEPIDPDLTDHLQHS